MVVAVGGLGRLDVGPHLGRVVELQYVRVLGRHDEEGGAEEGVGAGGEDGVVGIDPIAAEDDLSALGAPNPGPLHRLDVLGPVDLVKAFEQAVGVPGDREEPLLELLRLDDGAAALAATVDHLLVGEHRLVLGAPVDRGLAAVGELLLEEPEEEPLRPAVVSGLAACDLARPVDRDPPRLELAPELLDRGPVESRGCSPVRIAWFSAGSPEGVIAHRVDHLEAVAAPEMGDGIPDRVVLQMADVGLARGIGEHLEHVGLGLRCVEALLPRVGKPPRCARPPSVPATCAPARGGRSGRLARSRRGCSWTRESRQRTGARPRGSARHRRPPRAERQRRAGARSGRG